MIPNGDGKKLPLLRQYETFTPLLRKLTQLQGNDGDSMSQVPIVHLVINLCFRIGTI